MMNRDELRERLREVCYEVVETLLEKREDYGTQNIAITGRYGVAVRLQDKVSRALNLEAGHRANFESTRDTYLDIMGYALIGLVGEGWGLEPLAEIQSSLAEHIVQAYQERMAAWELHVEPPKIGGTE